MLVLSNSCYWGLQELGFDSEESAIANVLEADSVKQILNSYVISGAQCVCANTLDILPARLAHKKLDGRINEIAKNSLKIIFSLKPQHCIVELGCSGLPLDDASKNSLVEYKDQYVSSCRVFEDLSNNENLHFDAYLLSNLTKINQIKCALMGIRQASDKPIFVSVYLDDEGRLNKNQDIYDYAQVLQEFGASVAGFVTKNDIKIASMLCKRLRAGCDLPILVDLFVESGKDSIYASPDTMKEASIALNKAGAQFLRASGYARPAHSAVLCAMSAKMPLNTKIGV